MATLSSNPVELDLEAAAFHRSVGDLGWGDGLPCLPPVPDEVARFVEAANRPADEVVAVLPPFNADCTVEKIAINAVMAGAPAKAMPLLCAAVEAVAHPDLCLAGVNATTASVVPALIVNGPIRNHIGIPHGHSAFGGVRGPAPSIGRALRLIMRHIAGQVAGITSESVFGQPARVVGLVTGEWEERSPWRPLAERRGVPGDAVTAFGTMGTLNVVDTVADGADHLVEVMGKSAAYIGANGFLAATAFSEFALAINPVWAEIIAASYPDVKQLQAALWEHAALPIDFFPRACRPGIEELGRVRKDGRVHLVASPEDVLVFVAGGPGSLHAHLLHGFSASLAVTVPVGR
ncbi:hypothetical protein PSU4_53570 [Pseudonocardia sulfidoxydans NBRC 16205]|uniref:Uncharacterized protein n=1 Tax=Pseudonocardia sulfidoxydans NBRC 16205 TaxID=1223511 RepID=A0A511DQ83_9PSEU|nr:hypothetical protein [Pseudonocardia sulfidoxydans]GEL26403.1 hypothetical protein PSU4_53570 [Pseudonocardia sulfidoxydans NBRC 16205]